MDTMLLPPNKPQKTPYFVSIYMKAFVDLCGLLNCGYLHFGGIGHLHSSCFSYQEHNTKRVFISFIINVGVLVRSKLTAKP